MTFVEVESLEKAEELCRAGLLWYKDNFPPWDTKPWGPYNEHDCPTYWGNGAWSYYILLED